MSTSSRAALPSTFRSNSSMSESAPTVDAARELVALLAEPAVLAVVAAAGDTGSTGRGSKLELSPVLALPEEAPGRRSA